jgi:hypothetical protein
MSNVKDLDKKISIIRDEIGKIANKENNLFFYVIDTYGYASGSLAYIYQLAKFLYDEGYKVKMLYQTDSKGKENEEFVGVGGWLGEEYASLPHYDIQSKKGVEVSHSDILFIPEIYSQVMAQTKKMPCKRIAVFQNYDFVVSQMPYSAQWGDYGITDAIVNTKENAELLKSIFPYVNVTIIDPFIEKRFGTTTEPKKMIVNVISKNPDDIVRLMKPFYWKYPDFKWVTFRDLSGMSKDNFANSLREGCITVWMDENASFGYSAIEAMKSGNIVFGKVPRETKEWMLDKDGNLSDCCIWFDDINKVHQNLAVVIRSFLKDSVPASVFEAQERAKNLYSEDKTKEEIISYVEKVMDERKKSFEEFIRLAEDEKNNNVVGFTEDAK